MTCESLNQFPDSVNFRRPASKVMRLERLGSAHPMRLSFLRILLRRVEQENWQFKRAVFDLDSDGVGHAIYSVTGPERTYSLVCFSHDLPADKRSDRVIATAWDATFTLFDGVTDRHDIERLEKNVPHQEAGRVSSRELTLSRANRSVRLFNDVVKTLSQGNQPDLNALAKTGYLMRTTAVYGSGKFGAADWRTISDRPEMMCPFQAEMLSVWLIRSFTIDLVNHLAEAKGGNSSVKLGEAARNLLGVGNSTGLGMAPYLVKHPVLFNNLVMVREEALARVRSLKTASENQIEDFSKALGAAVENAHLWQSEHPVQVKKLAQLRQGLADLSSYLDESMDWDATNPWDALWQWGDANLQIEAQEALLSLLLEPHGSIIDDLACCMSDNQTVFNQINGGMLISQMNDLIKDSYSWALDYSYKEQDECARFWYVSEDKLEPRLGERHSEPGHEQELPLDIGRQVSQLSEQLAGWNKDTPIAEFLLMHPQFRNIVRRLQKTINKPFAEIQDNLISAELMPIDMLRCKLAFFGANRFDPRSDRWVRISLFQGLPYPDELCEVRV